MEKTKLSAELIDKVLEAVRADAERRRIDAAYMGDWDDRGASEILLAVAAYEAGRAGGLPSAWEGHLQNARQQTDPEFAEYERLREKFG